MTKPVSDPLALLSRAEREPLAAAIRHGASRRDVMGLLAAAGIATGFGGLPIGSATSALAQTPKKGGKIRVAGFGSSTADTLDPAKQSYSTDYCRCTMFYNRLPDLDDRLNPTLSPADSSEHHKATVWTSKLRKGVHLHDGKELPSAGVVLS